MSTWEVLFAVFSKAPITITSISSAVGFFAVYRAFNARRRWRFKCTAEIRGATGAARLLCHLLQESQGVIPGDLQISASKNLRGEETADSCHLEFSFTANRSQKKRALEQLRLDPRVIRVSSQESTPLRSATGPNSHRYAEVIWLNHSLSEADATQAKRAAPSRPKAANHAKDSTVYSSRKKSA